METHWVYLQAMLVFCMRLDSLPSSFLDWGDGSVYIKKKVFPALGLIFSFCSLFLLFVACILEPQGTGREISFQIL